MTTTSRLLIPLILNRIQQSAGQHRLSKCVLRQIAYTATIPGSTVPVDDQSFVIPGNENIRTSKLLRDPQVLWERGEGGEETVYEAFQRGIQLSENGPFLGTRNKTTGKYEWTNYEQIRERVMNVGSAFQQFGILPGAESFIGINTGSRPEFTITWLASACFRTVFVPIFSNLGKEGVNFIVTKTEIPLLVCDTEDKVLFLLNQKSQFPKLKTFVFVDEPSSDLRKQVRDAGAEILSLAEFESMGKRSPKDPVFSKSEDLFTICWTSGTTGMPKGVLITNRNVLSGITAIIEGTKPANLVKPVVISYMPPAHIYEILIQVQTLYNGGKIGFFSGDVLKLMEDIRELQPTFLPMVPRLLNRVYIRVLDEIKANPMKNLFLNTALKRKHDLLKKGTITQNTIWDKFIFNKVREEFGGKLIVMSNSAAPLSREVAQFFRCSLGCYLFDVYGQTELGPVTLTTAHEVAGGNVGPPLPCCQVKLDDVPEMGYFSKDGVGEICVRGPTVCKGYYKNPEATKDTIDQDGWLHTGDVGKWLANGTLAVVDRKKNLFKMSQGEFISPEKIENVYAQSSIVGQIFVTGSSEKDYVIAVIVPDSANISDWCQRKGLGTGTLEELCKKKDVKLAILTHLRKLGVKDGLNSLEQIKNVYLHPHLMTVDNSLMTPTLKVKRNIAKKYFQTHIDKIYEEGPLC